MGVAQDVDLVIQVVVVTVIIRTLATIMDAVPIRVGLVGILLIDVHHTILAGITETDAITPIRAALVDRMDAVLVPGDIPRVVALLAAIGDRVVVFVTDVIDK